jgi:hypothetical protein
LSWSGQKYGKVEDDIKRKSDQLAALQRNESPALASQIKSLQREIDELLFNSIGSGLETGTQLSSTHGFSTEGKLTTSGALLMSRAEYGGRIETLARCS